MDVLDSIVEELSREDVLNRIGRNQYDVILSLVGTASWDQDLGLMHDIRSIVPEALLVVSGNIALFEYHWVFSNYPSIDVCLLDYTTDDLKKYLDGERNSLSKIVYRTKENEVVVKDERVSKNFSYPIPHHHKFKNHLYHLPLAIRHPSAIVITSAGCPHKCEFCVASEIPYRLRPVEEVVNELKYLFGIGIREVFFQDFMFDVKYERTMELCQALIDSGIDLSWYCSCRVDTLDEKLLMTMRRAGCHTIQFGIESSEQQALDEQRKKTKTDQIKEVLGMCNRVGIRVFGHFILGLPGDTERSMLQQGKYAREIGCHNAVFDTLVPDVGTQLRRNAISEGKIEDELTLFSNSDKNFDVCLNDQLDAQRLDEIRKKVMIDFYLHPKFIWNNIIQLESFYELRQKLKFGVRLLSNV